MPQQQDLCGLGLSPPVASALGNSTTALTTTGTTQATAATVLSQLVVLTTAGSQTGAIMPSTALIGTPYYVFNSTATTAVVYGPTSSTLNGSASTSGLSVAQNKTAILIQVSRGVWASLLTA